MSIVATVVWWFLQIFILFLWIRFIVDLVRSFRQGWRPRGTLLVILTVIFAVTDPPLKLVRRIIKPARFGGVSIDFSWTIVLVAAIVLTYVAASLARH